MEWKYQGNPLIESQRMPGMNLMIEEGDDPESCLYAVYCSSNGIYYPNNDEVFRKRIIEQNKYDWRSNRIKGRFCKHIYIRDILKQWYVEGINSELDTIFKVAEWIRTYAKPNAEFVFLGSSAGGYMSICLASILGGMAFACSPQVKLRLSDKYPALIKHNDDYEYSKMYDLEDVIKNSKKSSDYFIICGAYNEEDNRQIGSIASLDKCHVIKLKTDLHGVCFFPFNAVDFYNKREVLKRIAKKGSPVCKLSFSIQLSGTIRTVSKCCKRVLRR